MSENQNVVSPPHSAEAERAILGAILRSPEQLNYLNDKIALDPKYFFIDSHKCIYEAICLLDSKNAPIDCLTIYEVLSKQEKSVVKIDPTYLVELTESCPVAQHVDYYALIVKNKYYLRKIISACQKVVHKAVKVEGDALDFIGEVEKEFLEIANDSDKGDGLSDAKKILVKTLEVLDKRIALDSDVTGVSSGFDDLDKIIGGWQKSDLIILAARPGMGKTALVMGWALGAFKKSNAHIAIFTLEMSKVQLMERLLSSEGHVDSTQMRKGDLSEEAQDRLMRAARNINKNGERLSIDETPGLTLAELRSRCRRQKKEKGLDLIIIDYLQLMNGSETAKKQGREREIGEISMGLKALAKELDVPVIAAAQLNRGPDARPDKKPRMSDLRESGSMEQDADQIIFIYRDDYYNPNSESAGKAEIIISKNRHGETASVFLAWLPNFVSFHNLMPDS
jgi:replicative DNA helicase